MSQDAATARILVCGGRAYSNFGRIVEVLDKYHSTVPGGIACIIHGAGGRVQNLMDGRRVIQGADLLAEEWAKLRNVQFDRYPAAWRVFGKSAGMLRNARMLREGAPHLVLAFPGGAGTADMVERGKRAAVRVTVLPALGEADLRKDVGVIFAAVQ